MLRANDILAPCPSGYRLGIKVPGTPEHLAQIDKEWYRRKTREGVLAEEGQKRALAQAGMLDPSIAQYFMDEDSNKER